MKRSHPPTLLRLAARLIRDERLVARGERVLCACSGGPDSTALLHVLASLRGEIGHEVVAHAVDHGLRPPDEVAAELRLVEETAGALGVPFGVARVAVAPGGNVQARARAARLEALARAARAAGASAIATGHTADDRAETFLLRLLRGAGPAGLAVLPPRAPVPLPGTGDLRLVRPLLAARRADVLAHLARHGLRAAEDPSNRDPRFARVRVRRELLPLLEDLSPRVVEHLGALADALADDAEARPASTLGRAQRVAVRRAERLGRPAVTLRLAGGRDVALPLRPKAPPRGSGNS